VGEVRGAEALDMLQARRTAIKETPEEEAEGVDKDDIAVTPLGVPMLAGPGAITAVLLLTQQASTIGHRLVLSGNIIAVSFLTFLIFRLAAMRPAGLSTITLKLITRLMGLLLAAVAVQYILNGIEAIRG
jgi:multiple antibiotic resistance protein